MKIDNLVLELELRQQHPAKLLTLGDCINRWSIARAECKNATAKYHFQIQTFCGIATLVDCFSAVDQLLFIDHSTTLSELVAAVESDKDPRRAVTRAPRCERGAQTRALYLRIHRRVYFGVIVRGGRIF